MILLERSLVEAEARGKLYSDDLKIAVENGYSIVRMRNGSHVVVWFSKHLSVGGPYSHFTGEQVYGPGTLEHCVRWTLQTIGGKR